MKETDGRKMENAAGDVVKDVTLGNHCTNNTKPRIHDAGPYSLSNRLRNHLHLFSGSPLWIHFETTWHQQQKFFSQGYPNSQEKIWG